MAKREIQRFERFAVWYVYNGYCFWCGKPVNFSECEVDHVLAESLGDDLVRLAGLLKDYGLPPDFDLNDFPNWVASCGTCNRKKGARTYRASRCYLASIESAVATGPHARNYAAKIAADRKKGALLGRVAAAIDAGTILKEDISVLFADVPRPPNVLPRLLPHLNLSPEWNVVRIDGNLAWVEGPRGFGFTSALPNPDGSWFCPHCGTNGPWDGIICRNCGMRSDPND